ncbi:MAG: hypothetical protein V3T49_02765 [Dehalococcoidia bacterium]
MKVPKITMCPGCGLEPTPFRDNKEHLGVWCDSCGFNSSLVDEMHAEYLNYFHPKIDIRIAAQRIRDRMPLLHSMAKAA